MEQDVVTHLWQLVNELSGMLPRRRVPPSCDTYAQAAHLEQLTANRTMTEALKTQALNVKVCSDKPLSSNLTAYRRLLPRVRQFTAA